VVKNQISSSGLIREGFADLLSDPGARRMVGDVEMENAPAVVRNDEKAIEQVEGDRRHREEIHGNNGFSMIAQE
jgi:hypothetical protein